MTHQSKQPDCKLHDSLREGSRAVVSKAVPSVLSRPVPVRAAPPRHLLLFLRGLSATGRWVRSGGGGSVRRSSRKVHRPHRIAKHASTAPTFYEGELLYGTLIVPGANKKGRRDGSGGGGQKFVLLANVKLQ